ncbi:MAG: hypothetical protein KDH94_07125, partial [Coxiellaceae bacterium]|nr:hypothetical protein [Coxiellaceae bacterium]
MSTAYTLLKNDFNALRKGQQQRQWYITMGVSNAGKATLLQNVAQSHHGEKRHSASTLCEYWQFADATFLDITAEITKQHQETFTKLFRFMKKKKCQISGIIVCAPLCEYMLNQQQYDRETEWMRALIAQLMTLYPGLSVTVIATKSDLILGFNEFFTDLGPEERQHPCGLQFPTPPYQQSLPELCDAAFSTLLKRFNDRLLWRVQHEQEQHKRHLITDFPVQFELLKPHLGYFLNQILPSIDITLNGIYFVSCVQMDAPINHAATSLQRVFNILPAKHHPATLSERCYFVADLFTQLLQAEQRIVTSTLSNRLSYGTACLAVASIATGAYYLYFHQNSAMNLQASKQLLERSLNNTATNKPFQQV